MGKVLRIDDHRRKKRPMTISQEFCKNMHDEQLELIVNGFAKPVIKLENGEIVYLDYDDVCSELKSRK